MQQRGIVPEYEVFDLGHLATLQRLLDKHGPPHGGHVHVDLVMGVPGGMPGTRRRWPPASPHLPDGATFAATGVGRTSLPVMLAALSAGGHLRVGMEDTLTYAPGEPVRDNAQLVARAAGLARIAQRPPMTPDEARSCSASPVPTVEANPMSPKPTPAGGATVDALLDPAFLDGVAHAAHGRGAPAAPSGRAGGGQPLLHPPAAAGPARHRAPRAAAPRRERRPFAGRPAARDPLGEGPRSGARPGPAPDRAAARPGGLRVLGQLADARASTSPTSPTCPTPSWRRPPGRWPRPRRACPSGDAACSR